MNPCLAFGFCPPLWVPPKHLPPPISTFWGLEITPKCRTRGGSWYVALLAPLAHFPLGYTPSRARWNSTWIFEVKIEVLKFLLNLKWRNVSWRRSWSWGQSFYFQPHLASSCLVLVYGCAVWVPPDEKPWFVDTPWANSCWFSSHCFCVGKPPCIKNTHLQNRQKEVFWTSWNLRLNGWEMKNVSFPQKKVCHQPTFFWAGYTY